jgi:sentrin-specific protease 1
MWRRMYSYGDSPYLWHARNGGRNLSLANLSYQELKEIGDREHAENLRQREIENKQPHQDIKHAPTQRPRSLSAERRERERRERDKAEKVAPPSQEYVGSEGKAKKRERERKERAQSKSKSRSRSRSNESEEEEEDKKAKGQELKFFERPPFADTEIKCDPPPQEVVEGRRRIMVGDPLPPTKAKYINDRTSPRERNARTLRRVPTADEKNDNYRGPRCKYEYHAFYTDWATDEWKRIMVPKKNKQTKQEEWFPLVITQTAASGAAKQVVTAMRRLQDRNGGRKKSGGARTKSVAYATKSIHPFTEWLYHHDRKTGKRTTPKDLTKPGALDFILLQRVLKPGCDERTRYYDYYGHWEPAPDLPEQLEKICTDRKVPFRSRNQENELKCRAHLAMRDAEDRKAAGYRVTRITGRRPVQNAQVFKETVLFEHSSNHEATHQGNSIVSLRQRFAIPFAMGENDENLNLLQNAARVNAAAGYLSNNLLRRSNYACLKDAANRAKLDRRLRARVAFIGRPEGSEEVIQAARRPLRELQRLEALARGEAEEEEEEVLEGKQKAPRKWKRVKGAGKEWPPMPTDKKKRDAKIHEANKLFESKGDDKRRVGKYYGTVTLASFRRLDPRLAEPLDYNLMDIGLHQIERQVRERERDLKLPIQSAFISHEILAGRGKRWTGKTFIERLNQMAKVQGFKWRNLKNVFYPIEPDRNFYVLLVFRIPQKRIEIFSSFSFGLPLDTKKRGELTKSPIQLLNALLGRKETWQVAEVTRAQGDVTDTGLYTLFAISRLASGTRVVLKDADDLRLRFAASILAGTHGRAVAAKRVSSRSSSSSSKSSASKQDEGTVGANTVDGLLRSRGVKVARGPPRLHETGISKGTYISAEDNKSIGLGFLKVGDVRTLGRNHWLNDEVINHVVEMLRKLSPPPPSVIMSTFFYTKLMQIPSGVYNYPGVKKSWTKLSGKRNISQIDRIFVPVHFNHNHWILVVVDMKRKRIEQYDSYNEDNKRHSEILQNIQRWVKDESDWKIDATAWPSVSVPVEQQQNGSDCGVFMLLTLKRLVENRPLDFTQAMIPAKRVQIASDILKKKLTF